VRAAGRRRFPEGGFTYLIVLLFIAVSALALGSVAQVWATAAKREREKELIFVLGQFHQAIQNYVRASTGPQAAQAQAQVAVPAEALPQELDDLIKDPRAPDVRRYLRRIYVDPMTGSAQWGLIRRQGRIVGVYSLSEDQPIGKNYALASIDFNGATKYSDWQVILPVQLAVAVAPAAGMAEPGAAAASAQPSLPPARTERAAAVATPPRERPNTTDRDLTVMSDTELNQYCTQLNLLDLSACSASRALKPLGKMQCAKSASARQAACILKQNDLPPLYLAEG